MLFHFDFARWARMIRLALVERRPAVRAWVLYRLLVWVPLVAGLHAINKANEVLERLSGGTMTVRFVTQSAYKDKRRDDLKETLDIQISDGSGTRDYEMFSGGEAFRVNFAIRLALSEVLAQRAGARLQTLVIDEGFGSQDSEGRQRPD